MMMIQNSIVSYIEYGNEGLIIEYDRCNYFDTSYAAHFDITINIGKGIYQRSLYKNYKGWINHLLMN